MKRASQHVRRQASVVARAFSKALVMNAGVVPTNMRGEVSEGHNRRLDLTLKMQSTTSRHARRAAEYISSALSRLKNRAP